MFSIPPNTYSFTPSTIAIILSATSSSVWKALATFIILERERKREIKREERERERERKERRKRKKERERERERDR